MLIDEAHRLYEFNIKWLKDPEWADVPFIGLSATPWTRGLGAALLADAALLVFQYLDPFLHLD